MNAQTETLAAADALKAWRRARSMNQSQLAGALHIHRVTLSNWERGHSTPPPYLYRALRDIDTQQEQTMNTYAIIDEECSAATFWDALPELHPGLAARLDLDHAEPVTPEERDLLEAVHGFHGSDKRAPAAITFLTREEAVDAGWLEEE